MKCECVRASQQAAMAAQTESVRFHCPQEHHHYTAIAQLGRYNGWQHHNAGCVVGRVGPLDAIRLSFRFTRCFQLFNCTDFTPTYYICMHIFRKCKHLTVLLDVRERSESFKLGDFNYVIILFVSLILAKARQTIRSRAR